MTRYKRSTIIEYFYNATVDRCLKGRIGLFQGTEGKKGMSISVYLIMSKTFLLRIKTYVP